MSGGTRPLRRLWRVSAGRRLSDLYVGLRWTRESKQSGELYKLSVCLVPGYPLDVSCLQYERPDGAAR